MIENSPQGEFYDFSPRFAKGRALSEPRAFQAQEGIRLPQFLIALYEFASIIIF
ncbi:hypothetical protein HMPREF1986_02640 [Oribacterium sp. oral taxon 078 str. F0263]|nr:hypothetical protein HMPREF1986_02640 [Oribacterium sp. oral taxon 078 str. F0263]